MISTHFWMRRKCPVLVCLFIHSFTNVFRSSCLLLFFFLSISIQSVECIIQWMMTGKVNHENTFRVSQQHKNHIYDGTPDWWRFICRAFAWKTESLLRFRSAKGDKNKTQCTDVYAPNWNEFINWIMQLFFFPRKKEEETMIIISSKTNDNLRSWNELCMFSHVQYTKNAPYYRMERDK